MSNLDIGQGERAKKAGIGRQTQIKLSLARRRPDLLEEVRAGRMTTHRAAVQAGIVKQDSPFETARKAIEKALPKLTPAERVKLKELL
jgi:hypothetical protein